MLSLLLALGLVLTHLVAGRLRFLGGIPRSRWLSLAGGISVAYVFVHLMPELSLGQESVERAGGFGLALLERHVYVVALLGLAVFYGLEKAARESREHRREAEDSESRSRTVFWLHIASYSVYNLLIGYLLLHRETPGTRELVLFAFAMAVHFVVNDFGLREHYQATYDRIGRWALSLAVVAGWGAGRMIEVGEAALGLLFAFIAGGVVLNVLKEELPEERRSCFWAFALGATLYTVVLLTI